MRVIIIFNREELKLLSVFFVIVFTALVANPSTTQAQYKYDYEWLLGYNGEGWDHPRFALSKISFHSNPPDTIRTPIIGSTGAVATLSMANSKGGLIFYSNGCSLFDHKGEVIPGGEKIVEGKMYETHCLLDVQQNAYLSWIQSLFALPMDNSDSLFFMINHRYEWTHNTNFESPTGLVAFDLQLTHIVQSADGSYQVDKTEILVEDLVSLEGMVAVRDPIPNYWWLIVPPSKHKRNYRTIRLGPEGLDTIMEFDFDYSEFNIENKIGGGGQSAICPSGDTFVKWIPEDTIGTLVFDFDRSTGELSNMRHLPHPERDNYEPGFSSGGGGAAISPNGRFLYINTRNNLYQYDLEAGDIAESKVHIAEYDGFRDPGNNFQVAFFMQQLAPDCRIYISATNTVRYLHVINHPNRKGKACDFQQHSFKLPGNHGIGIPYHPNYRLGTDYPVCDSTLTTTVTVLPEAEGGIHLYPNPARDYAVVEWSGMDPVDIALYDMSGREVYRSPMQPGSPEYYLDLSRFSAGVYIVRLRDRDGGVMTERLVVME
jgi:hypothetical protein